LKAVRSCARKQRIPNRALLASHSHQRCRWNQ